MPNQRIKPLVLVVDDLESHLKAIGNTLLNSGFEVALAFNGKRAIEIAKNSIPDLILLDIVMPEIDGYEVCRQLKADENTKEIPIIFLTSQKDSEFIVKGFQLGAVDYIVKPANKDETLARVNTHLELKKSRETILEQNEKMRSLLNEKNEFLELASKDLRNPINEIRGYNDLINKFNANSNFKSREIVEYSGKINLLTRQMMTIINDLLFLNDVEQGRVKSIFQSIDIHLAILKIIKEYEPKAKPKRITIDYESGIDHNTLVVADKEKLDVVLDNLISNAVKFSKFYKYIYIKTYKIFENQKELIAVEIRDQGVGMSKEDLQNLFIKFAKLSSKPTDNESSIGLGLATVKLLIDEMNGTIAYDSKEDEGTVVIFTLPVAQ
jgi:two-component system, sensor histidine kinase and response regulator